MRTTQQRASTLPNELALAVNAKVTSGEYASESEVIRDGPRVLMARHRAVERWLKTQVGPAYDALEAGPAHAAREWPSSIPTTTRRRIRRDYKNFRWAAYGTFDLERDKH